MPCPYNGARAGPHTNKMTVILPCPSPKIWGEGADPESPTYDIHRMDKVPAKISAHHALSVCYIYRTRMALIFRDEYGLETLGLMLSLNNSIPTGSGILFRFRLLLICDPFGIGVFVELKISD
jgi:hypothetical protein